MFSLIPNLLLVPKVRKDWSYASITRSVLIHGYIANTLLLFYIYMGPCFVNRI